MRFPASNATPQIRAVRTTMQAQRPKSEGKLMPSFTRTRPSVDTTGECAQNRKNEIPFSQAKVL